MPTVRDLTRLLSRELGTPLEGHAARLVREGALLMRRPRRWLLVLALGALLSAAPVAINWEVFDPDWRPPQEAR